MCSGSEAGSFLRLMDFLSLNSRLEINKEEEDIPRERQRGRGGETARGGGGRENERERGKRETGRGIKRERRREPLHPTPYTLHPTPCTLHSTLHTLHPTTYALHPTPSERRRWMDASCLGVRSNILLFRLRRLLHPRLIFLLLDSRYRSQKVAEKKISDTRVYCPQMLR